VADKEKAKRSQRRKPESQVPYFFIEGHLHKTLHIHRSKDTITTYDFIDEKVKKYLWSYVRRHKQKAFRVSEVAKMIGRHPDRIHRAIYQGKVPTPQKIPYWKWGMWVYMLSEDDVLEVWRYFAGIHIGRPRKDGLVTNNSIPNREEMLMQMRTGKVLYMEEDGEYVPVWRAEDW
jgi:hypothetical protein